MEDDVHDVVPHDEHESDADDIDDVGGDAAPRSREHGGEAEEG